MAENNQDAVTSKNQLKDWWVTRAKPSQAQYYLWMDAYWHKSESIPPVKITGLSELLQKKADADQLQYYAKVDATNIDVDTWKDVLGVGGELPENVATIDWQNEAGFVIEGNAYKKVANPNDGNVYVLNIDGTKVNANTFGKNIANADLTTSGSFTHTQRTQDTFEWKTQGASYKISGLLDKSADASFVDFVGKNEQGEFAKVGYPAFIKTVDSWNNAQRLEFLRKLNNNATEVAMTIGAIYPAVMPLENYPTTIIISGANLNLDQTSRKIEILKANSEDILATIPGADITVINPNEINFTKNISFLGVGEYKVRIYSGLFMTTSELTFQILDNLVPRDLSTLQWNIITHPSYTNSQTIAYGGNLSMVKETAKLTDVPEDSVFLSAKSAPIFYAGEDWYVEIDLNDIFSTNTLDARGKAKVLMNSLGIMYNSTANLLTPLGLIKFKADAYSPNWYTFAYYYFLNNLAVEDTGNGSVSYNKVLAVYKQGNVLKMAIAGKTVSLVISNNEDYSFIGQLTKGAGDTETIINIRQLIMNVLKAYKIN